MVGILAALLALAAVVTVRYVQALRQLQRGRDDLVAAEAILREGSLGIPPERLRQATSLLEDAQQALGPRSSLISDGWVIGGLSHLPILDRQVEAVRSLRSAGSTGAALGLTLIPILDEVRGTSNSGSGLVTQLVNVARSRRPALDQASADLDALDGIVASVPNGSLVGPLDHARGTARDAIQRIDGSLRSIINIVRVLPDAVGGGQHGYLLLLTNPGEERGGGGFIGAVGLLSFSDGKLVSSEFRASEFSNTLVTDIPAPRPIRDITHTALVLADADWSPDFPTTATLAKQFYTRATGTNVDGVIAVDPVALSYVLELTGPIRVPGYPQTITATNALMELNYISNLARPGDPGKVFLPPFGHAMIDAAFSTPKAQWSALAAALERGVAQKHIVLNFADVRLQQLVTDGAAGGILGPARGDSLLIDDSNLSGTKGDLYVTRHFDLRATVDPQGYVNDIVTATYRSPVLTDPADAALVRGTAGLYEDYLRIYLPESASLGTLRVSDNGAPTVAVSPEEVGIESHRRWVAFRLLLPPGQSVVLSLSYGGQFADVNSNGTVSYTLGWSKQINALTWPVAVTVELPGGRQEHWDSDLSVDRAWQMSG